MVVFGWSLRLPRNSYNNNHYHDLPTPPLSGLSLLQYKLDMVFVGSRLVYRSYMPVSVCCGVTSESLLPDLLLRAWKKEPLP